MQLHWANADQFYIKSSDHIDIYEFHLTDGAHVRFELSPLFRKFGDVYFGDASGSGWYPASTEIELEDKSCTPPMASETIRSPLIWTHRGRSSASGASASSNSVSRGRLDGIRHQTCGIADLGPANKQVDVSTRLGARANGVVPLSVEVVGLEHQGAKLLVR